MSRWIYGPKGPPDIMEINQSTNTMKKKALLRAFHAACSAAGMSYEEKMSLVAGYGYQSSRDMSEAQLREAIALVNHNDADKWRKRVIAAVDAYLKAAGYASNMNAIKATACRAAGSNDFNKISLGRLQTLYNAFSKKAKDTHRVAALAGPVEFVMVSAGKPIATA